MAGLKAESPKKRKERNPKAEKKGDPTLMVEPVEDPVEAAANMKHRELAAPEALAVRLVVIWVLRVDRAVAEAPVEKADHPAVAPVEKAAAPVEEANPKHRKFWEKLFQLKR